MKCFGNIFCSSKQDFKLVVVSAFLSFFVMIVAILFTYVFTFVYASSFTNIGLRENQHLDHLETIANTTKYKVNTTPGFLTYENPSLGITMEYPSDWLKREYPSNPATNNNTLITFFSPSPSASALGNVSGVSGTFVPYVDIFVFSSKNMSIDEIVNGAINEFANSNLNESKSIVLKDNNPAHVLVYTVRIAGDELFKRMQVWTIRDYKVYVITFTAEEALYSEYLAKVQRMINSLEIRSPAVTS